MRHNQLLKEELRLAIQPFLHLIGQNEWLNFSEMVQLIRVSESISESSVKHAVMALTGRDGIIYVRNREITVSLIYGGYVLDYAS